jgi:hypothetical protein
MPDISMCGSKECKVRAECRRNPASGTVPSEWRQSWMMFGPEGPHGCDSFMPTRPEEKARVASRGGGK